MKWFFRLFFGSYALLLLFPLALVPSPTVTKPQDTPTSVTTPSKPTDKPTDLPTFTLLDKKQGVLYTYAARDFLIYTVAALMPADYHTEALKAQTVAAYSYYLYEKTQNADNTSLQGADSANLPDSFPASYSPDGLKTLWGEHYDQNLQTVVTAVDSVLGISLSYDDSPVCAITHPLNHGRTESATVALGTDFPYLVSVTSAGDTLSPSCTSTVTVSDTDFQKAFPSLTLSGDPASWIGTDPILSEGGTVVGLTIGGTSFTGNQLRERFSLPSASFTLAHGDSGFTFTVKGNGNAVGMSRFGANHMANQGFSYAEILAHYYPNTTLTQQKDDSN